MLLTVGYAIYSRIQNTAEYSQSWSDTSPFCQYLWPPKLENKRQPKKEANPWSANMYKTEP